MELWVMCSSSFVGRMCIPRWAWWSVCCCPWIACRWTLSSWLVLHCSYFKAVHAGCPNVRSLIWLWGCTVKNLIEAFKNDLKNLTLLWIIYPFSRFLLFPCLMWRKDIGTTSDSNSSSGFWVFFFGISFHTSRVKAGYCKGHLIHQAFYG